jgi:hypothetical protein
MARLPTVHVAPSLELFGRTVTYCGLKIDRPVESTLRLISLADRIGKTERLCARCRAALNPTFAVAIGGADVR